MSCQRVFSAQALLLMGINGIFHLYTKLSSVQNLPKKGTVAKWQTHTQHRKLFYISV